MWISCENHNTTYTLVSHTSVNWTRTCIHYHKTLPIPATVHHCPLCDLLLVMNASFSKMRQCSDRFEWIVPLEYGIVLNNRLVLVIFVLWEATNWELGTQASHIEKRFPCACFKILTQLSLVQFLVNCTQELHKFLVNYTQELHKFLVNYTQELHTQNSEINCPTL